MQLRLGYDGLKICFNLSSFLETHEQPASSSATPVPANKAVEQHQNSLYPLIAGAAGGGILLLIASLVVCLCLKRRENSQPEGKSSLMEWNILMLIKLNLCIHR